MAADAGANELHLETLGTGPPVLLVHGSVRNGAMCWGGQRPLAERWRLRIVDRRGFFPNPPAGGEDYDRDADDVAELLGDGAHLVGHSYGGLVSLLATARRPEAVRSLTVIEPPVFDVARGVAAVDELIAAFDGLWDDAPEDPRAFLSAFLPLVGSSLTLPDQLPPPLAQNVTELRTSRRPWQAELPLEQLRAAGVPTMVVSGGHHPAFEAVCDALHEALGGHREVLQGAGHTVPDLGPRFNDRLETFLFEVEDRSRTAT